MTTSKFDELDLRIVNALQRDSSISNQDLANTVHTSPPTCLRRVKRLYDLGVIQKQVAIVDASKFAPSLTAIVEITLDVQGAEKLDAFEKFIVYDPSVTQCYRVSTGPDFIVVLNVKDMPAYNELAHRLFTSQANVRNVRSFFAIHRAKFETQVPLALPT